MDVEEELEEEIKDLELEDYEEFAMDLNHERNHLDREHREELRGYELATNKLINSMNSQKGAILPETAIRTVDSLLEDGKLTNEIEKELRVDIKQTEQDLISTKEELEEALRTGHQAVQEIPKTSMFLKSRIDSYHDSVELMIEKTKIELFPDTEEELVGWGQQQSKELQKFANTMTEVLANDLNEYSSQVSVSPGAAESLHEENVQENADEMNLVKPPESFYRDLLINVFADYKHKLTEYKEKERRERRRNIESNEEDAQTEMVGEYDFSVLDSQYDKRERRIVKKIADLEREENSVQRSELETAYNWAWTDKEGLETPELSREEKSRLSDVKRSFEKYLKSEKVDSTENRRDKPDLERMLKTSEYLAQNGYQRVEVEL